MGRHGRAKGAPRWNRASEVESARRMLLEAGWPRVQMTLMLLVTGLTGFLASFVLLHVGVTSMGLRYPVAIVVAYAVFLLLLRLWIWAQTDSTSGIDVDLDVVANAGDLMSSVGGHGGSSATSANPFHGGGDFGGGGASDSWGSGSSSVASSVGRSGGGGGGGSWGGGGGGGGGLSLDLDDLWVVVVILAVLLASLVAALYVVYIAPALLAEVFVDGVLVTGLYRRMRGVEAGSWLLTAIKRTWIPTTVLVLFFGCAGFFFDAVAPGSHSMADIVRGLDERREPGADRSSSPAEVQ